MKKIKLDISQKTKKKDKTNEDYLSAAMKDIRKILDLNARGVNTMNISSKVRTSASYVTEVIEKGADVMEKQLREGYGMPCRDINVVITPVVVDEKPITTANTAPIKLATKTNPEII